MPKIITCFKWVVDEADIRVEPASHRLNLERVGYKISDYDRTALEAAAQLKEKYGGTVTALTIGGPSAKKSIKDALSRGADQACFVSDPGFEGLEPAQVAGLLGSVIGSRLEYDLILCGEGSSDRFSQQVGPRLAEKLGIPVVTAVVGLELESDRIIAERKLETNLEVVAVKLPALLTVLPDLNTPRIPGLRDTLDAAKKPVVTIAAAELPPVAAALIETVALQGLVLERNCVQFGADANAIRQLVETLRKSGAVG